MEKIVQMGRHFLHEEPKKALNIGITGASGNIGYSLVFMIAQGNMFGPNQPVNITLHSTERSAKILEGMVMELQDSALPLLNGIKGTQDMKVCFKDCDVAILMSSRPRIPGLQRDQFLTLNAEILKAQGLAINEVAKDNCKVLLVSNPVNTSAYMLAKFATKLPRKNITALTRLDQNRAIYQIALKFGVNIRQVKNPIIWGNHSLIVYSDIRHAVIENYPDKGKVTKVTEALSDPNWGRDEFIKAVQGRGGLIIRATEKVSVSSTAVAICDHMHDWIVGTEPGTYVSMGIISDGSYGVPEGLVFSMPVICKNGDYEIVQGIEIDDFARRQFEINIQELYDEKKIGDEGLAKLES